MMVLLCWCYFYLERFFFLKRHFFPPWPPWLNINRKFLECLKSVCRVKFYFIVSVFSFWRILYAYLSKNWTVAFFDVRQINFGFEHIRRQVLQTYRKKIDILWTVCTLYLRLTFLLNLFLCFSLMHRGLNHFHSCILMSGELYMQRSSVFTSFPMAASYWFTDWRTMHVIRLSCVGWNLIVLRAPFAYYCRGTYRLSRYR